MFGALLGAGTSAGGGMPSMSSSADSRTGPVTIGGFTFAPSKAPQWQTLVLVGVVALIALAALKR